MKYAEIGNAITVEDALWKIKANIPVGKTTPGFIWFTVKNKTGVIFELGGTYDALKMYIPCYDEAGIPVKYSYNEMVHMNFAIACGNTWEHPCDGMNTDEKTFIKIAKTKDFRKAVYERGSQREVVVVQDRPAKITFNK